MFLTRAMAGFAMDLTVHICFFQIFNILVTSKTGLLTGIMNLELRIVIQSCCPVWTILSESIRNQKMSQDEEKRDKYSKCNCKPWNLRRNIETVSYTHLTMTTK